MQRKARHRCKAQEGQEEAAHPACTGAWPAAASTGPATVSLPQGHHRRPCPGMCVSSAQMPMLMCIGSSERGASLACTVKLMCLCLCCVICQIHMQQRLRPPTHDAHHIVVKRSSRLMHHLNGPGSCYLPIYVRCPCHACRLLAPVLVQSDQRLYQCMLVMQGRQAHSRLLQPW